MTRHKTQRKTSCQKCSLLCFGIALAVGSLALPAWARRGGGTKAGPAMLNLKLGASIPIYLQDYSGSALNAFPAAFALLLEGGYAIDRGQNAYVVLPFQLQVGQRSDGGGFVSSQVTVTRLFVPLGFQYDVALPSVPGLYVYPRVSFGYAVMITSGALNVIGQGFSSSATYHGGVFTPELGIKYVYRGRLNIGLEPFSLPVQFYQFGGQSGQNIKVLLDYRLYGYAGVNF